MGQQARTILLTALVLGGGVILGATYFAKVPAVPESAVSRPPINMRPARATAQPTLEPAIGDAGTARRIAALEETVRALQAELAEGHAAIKPLLAVYEQAKARGLVGADPADGEPEVLENTASDDEGPGLVSRHLGLESRQAAELKAQYGKILEQAKNLEKRNAIVSVEGDTTTIKISAFGRDGETLRRSWDDWKRSSWTAQEREVYVKSGGDNMLFGGRLGAVARTIEIREAAGSIKVTESAHSSDGEEFSSVIQGPSVARSYVLENYLHLLN